MMYSQRSKLILSLVQRNDNERSHISQISDIPNIIAPSGNEIEVDGLLESLTQKNQVNNIGACSSKLELERNPHIDEGMTPTDGALELLFDSDDSVKDKDYLPENSSDGYESDESIPLANLKYKIRKINSQQNKENINLENKMVNEDSERTNESQQKKEEINLENEVVNRDSEGTNESRKRKRQKHALSLEERKTLKLRKKVESHKVKDNCKESCRKKCTEKISKNRQIQINQQFWQTNDIERKTFIMHNITDSPVKRRTSGDNSRRNHSLKYFLQNEDGKQHSVCKQFFLATLGYELKNDKILRNLVVHKTTGKIIPKNDARGRRVAHNKFNTDIIISHIESFKPTISHYRREHAPRRLYLPSDITIQLMYQKFSTDYPQHHISYELYRREVAKKNISFCKLGHEECFACETFLMHQKSSNHSNLLELNTTCDVCKSYMEHKKKYDSSRIEYTSDSDPQNEDICFSADLQKVIMLPRCDMYKEIIFVPRIIAFHESFVPVGKRANKQNNCYPIACIWHEGITGRKKEDIISTFYAFFLEMRDCKKITVWLDNCSGQNKNWALFCFFIYVVNCDLVNLNDLEIKYFEPGHTFMSADSFHHAVETQLKRKRKVYDFQDFKECVQNAHDKAKVIDMSRSIENFFDWPDHTSLTKLKNSNPRPYMSDIVHLKLKRGEKTLQYRNSFADDFITLNFLKANQMKSDLSCPSPKKKLRGISKKRKYTLLQKLLPILPIPRRQFWENFPEANGDEEESSIDDE